jgi:hypothetical protein
VGKLKVGLMIDPSFLGLLLYFFLAQKYRNNLVIFHASTPIIFRLAATKNGDKAAAMEKQTEKFSSGMALS